MRRKSVCLFPCTPLLTLNPIFFEKKIGKFQAPSSQIPNEDGGEDRRGRRSHKLWFGRWRGGVDARLGHTPNSAALRAYINYLALDRHKPKNRMHESSVQEMQQKLHVSQLREKALMERYDRQQERTEQMMQELESLKSVVGHLIQSVAEAKISA